jgi:hypothetical protein
MNIFKRAEVIRILQLKVEEGEIKSFSLGDNYLHIKKSKRTGFTIKFDQISQQNLVTLLKRKTPNSNVQNISDFYTFQIKRINGIK